MTIKRQRLQIAWPARAQAQGQADPAEPGLLVQFLLVPSATLVLEQAGPRGIAVTAGKNHGGYALDPAGWVRGQDKILLLANHDHDTPLGEVTDVKTQDTDVLFKSTLVEPEDKTTAWAQRWADAVARYRQGMLPAASVGFIPNHESIDFDPDHGFPIFRQWALVEVSLVAVGLDAGAVTQQQPPAAPPGAAATPVSRLLVPFPIFTKDTK
jgi:hypothetical protein